MHPHPGGGLTHVTAELKSLYGMIRSAWALEDGRFNWRITVPPNTRAAVYVPAQDMSQVTESGQAVESANGVTFLRMENGYAIFEVISGSYTFSSQLA
jgi:alpha-L-rhamnosidase